MLHKSCDFIHPGGRFQSYPSGMKIYRILFFIYSHYSFIKKKKDGIMMVLLVSIL